MIKYIASRFVDIFRDVDPESMKIKNTLSVPDDFYRQLMDYVLERGYLNEIGECTHFTDIYDRPDQRPGKVSWMKVSRLPVHPNEMKEYDLLTRWQGVLATLHTWGQRMIFILQRKAGETGLYLGTVSYSRELTSSKAIEQFKEAATGSMPGIGLDTLTGDDEKQDFFGSMVAYNTIGAVTGIPSFKKDIHFGTLQTLDQLAFGIRDGKGIECDFSLMVIADPLDDTVISETISKFRKMGSEIHLDVRRSLNEGESISQNRDSKIGLKAISGLLKSIPFVGGVLSGVASEISAGAAKTYGSTQAVTTEYLDKFAEYAEKLTDMHCERLQRGRNLGFWNTGIYVLGKSRSDINTVTGILRSIYSGDTSYVEPIRTCILNERSGAIDIARRNELIPLESDDRPKNKEMEEWNVFGKVYQFLSTPINTEELSLVTSLPRRDVPGLRFVKSSVRFANNPAEQKKTKKGKPVDMITLGRVVDTGVLQKNEYKIELKSLVRHTVIAGSTGSGKSTTCMTLINEVKDRNIPVLIIEPAKDDYVRWAIRYNKKIDENPDLTKEQKEQSKFDIYMPGVKSTEGYEFLPLKINPFQPAHSPGAPVDMMTRVEQVTAIINASLPNADVLPVIVDEAIYEYISQEVGKQFEDVEMTPLADYPRLDGVVDVAKKILQDRNYEQKIRDNLTAALETRFKYLTRGKRGQILNVNSSTDYNKLFNKPTIINVSRIANMKDKSLIMAMIMLALYEYRISCFSYDEEYRNKAEENGLLHLTVIEEANNLLRNPEQDFGGTGNPQKVVADMFSSMLSEIRSFGQGMVIVDQIPTRLIQDVIKNTNLKIVHRLVSPDDCSTMASGLALREDQQSMIPALSVGQTIICGDMDDAAAWVSINFKRFLGEEKDG